MKSSAKYIDLWSEQKENIKRKLLIANTRQSIQLNFNDFKQIGNRIKSGYRFNLEFIDGIVSNNIESSAVARDLAKVMENSSEIKKAINFGHFKINMDKNFCLWIQKLN